MTTSQEKDVGVIVVGLNACDYVRLGLHSIAGAEWNNCSYECVYVDNGSTDSTLSMLREEFPEVRVIANPSNLGFCKAANQGAEIANSRYYLFMNDDTIVQGDALATLAEFLDQTPDAGVVGGRLLNPDLTDQWSGRRFPSMWNAILGRRSLLSRTFPNAKPLTDYLYKDRLEKGVPFVADWVSAAALMVRKEAFWAVGGFAEDYYYWHEAVFCDRIRKTGTEVFLHPRSKIIHYEGQGSGKRPYKIRKWHIINFHLGAYRCYCEHYDLNTFSPQRLFAAAALSVRALVLLTANRLIGLAERA